MAKRPEHLILNKKKTRAQNKFSKDFLLLRFSFDKLGAYV